LKVLHVIPGIAPRYGGPSQVIVSMVTALNRLDNVRAEIATTDAGESRGSLAGGSPSAELPVHMFRKTWSERWKYSAGLRRWLRSYAPDYDLINIHAVWSFATVAAARSAAMHGVPYVLRPAGMLSDYTWNNRGWSKRLYWRLVERRTIDEAAAFHVTSHEEAAEVRAVRADAPVFVIPNGVDAAAFTAPRNPFALRQRCGPAAANLPILLFLSRLHPKKGVADRLLPAMVAMRTPCFLAIVGGEDPHAAGHASEIQAAINKLSLQHRVGLLGAVAADERWPLFDGADMFVLPSHSENFGIVVGEAMARGCPVVVTDEVQASSHVSAAGAGEVVPGNVPTLARALDDMLAEASRREVYGQAGRDYALRHFSWNVIAAEIRQMYADCLSRRKTSCKEALVAR
jgi:glycosyltransferase involved in cell wall biosynthesis